MAYIKQTWENLPSEETPISAERLTHMEEGIYNNSVELENKASKDIYADNAISLGRKANTTKGKKSIAVGTNVSATMDDSSAFGSGTTASGYYSSAKGRDTVATGYGANASGYNSLANGYYANAFNVDTVASGYGSNASGYGTKAASKYQNVQGKYNEADSSDTYAHIVGGGSSDSDRKNIHTVDWQGNAVYAGDVTDGNGNVLSKKVNLPVDTEGNAVYGTSGQVLKTNGDGSTEWVDQSSGSGESGTTDYEALNNKPSIGDVTLSGNKTLDELGIQAKGDYLTEVPEGYVTEEELTSKGYLTEVPEEYVNQTEMEEYAQPKGDYLTEETDPTVPSWAKENTKPTYSKSEVGLGNVPNVTTNNQTPTFTESTERANIASGEKLSVIFGKIMKWFTDLKPHAFVAPITNLLTTVAGSALDATMGKELDDKISANTTAIEEVNSSLIIKEYTSTLSTVEIEANGNGTVIVNIPDASEYIANGYFGYVMSAFLFDSSIVSNTLSPHVGTTDGNISIAYINNYTRTSGSPKVTIAWKK